MDQEKLESLWQWGHVHMRKLKDWDEILDKVHYMCREPRELGVYVPGEQMWTASRGLVRPQITYTTFDSDAIDISVPSGCTALSDPVQLPGYGGYKTIESLFCHQQGEDLLGRPLRGKPLILEPFQLFVIYNVCGFFYPGTELRRFQEVLAMLARKNGKTPFATSFCWAVGLWYARSFSKIKTVSGSMKQNMEGFGFLRYNLRRLGLTMDIDPAHGLRMLDSSLGHSFEGPIWDGQISFEALAYKPDVFDAFNANVVLLDELELYKNAIPYGRLKDATKAYGNKLIMAVTTAGDDGTGFCAQRVSYCSKIARGEITGADADRIFAFIARADPDPDTDEVNYLDPAKG